MTIQFNLSVINQSTAHTQVIAQLSAMSRTVSHWQFPKIHCVDGFTISMQCSEYHYSTPRNNTGPYTHVELGFPSARPTEEIMEYVEDADDPTGTVYAYVPIELVVDMLVLHGGIKV